MKKTSEHKDVEIIPAVMPTSYADLQQKMGRIEGLVPWVHLDMMDGFFVPSTSWPYHAEDVVAFTEQVQRKKVLPYTETMHYEIDLMVEHPEEEISKWYALGVRRFIVHFESLDSADALEHILLEYSKEGVSEVGIAIGMETPISEIEPILKEVDFVHFMAIKKIGFQGEPFDPAVYDKIKSLRKVYKKGIISVDGGVSLENARELLNAGVDRLISGSVIFNSESIPDILHKFQSL
jgi:ribulose-phosphate 3-epimerase